MTRAACREFSIEIVRRLRQAGSQALWAGGCVRDLLLGETPADFDVATGATPEQVMSVLPYHTITVGIAFGVVRVRHPGQPGVEVEVATFRSDGAYVDGRRPESVVFSSPRLDAERRDFTINGMFMDPLTEELIDYVGGHEDLKNRVLRAIGDPAARLREDRLRALRRSTGGAVPASDRSGHADRAAIDGRRSRDCLRGANRAGAAANARA